MNIADFEKQPRGPYLFDWWAARQRIETPLGLFSVEFQMLGEDDTNPPDDEMLRRASELVSYAENNALAPGWLETCEVPRRLRPDRIRDYLRENGSLVVSRHLDWDEPYSSSIHVCPLWDEEHALTLDVRDGAIVAANGSRFRLLETGVLDWIED